VRGLEEERLEAHLRLGPDLLDLGRAPTVRKDDEVGPHLAVEADVLDVEDARGDADVNVGGWESLAHEADAPRVADHDPGGTQGEVPFHLAQEHGDLIGTRHDVDGDPRLLPRIDGVLDDLPHLGI
jgi:hypothetical protein